MAEDLKATRRVAPVRSDEPPERLARHLDAQDLSARGPQITLEGEGSAAVSPVRRWSSSASSVPEIERELNRIWGSAALRSNGDGERHVAARTSVLSLVVVAGKPEVGEHCAATIAQLAGRHPSRSLILTASDPDGPSWLKAQIEAHCMLPPAGTTETCSEMIYITAGGDSGRHLGAIIVPLLVHDLPVALWWPYEPQFRSQLAERLLANVDRLIVDGSAWPGDGLSRLVEMAELARSMRIGISDFAMIRQARWREAIASVYDLPELRPHLREVRSISVDYAASDGDPEGTTNVVKPVYHVAWLASRLGMEVSHSLHRDIQGWRVATLRHPRGEVAVVLRPVASQMPPGTTLRVELVSRRRGSQLVGDVTAGQHTVDVAIVENGERRFTRSYLAPRQGEVDLLAHSIEESGHDPVAAEALAMAEHLITARPIRRRAAQRMAADNLRHARRAGGGSA